MPKAKGQDPFQKREAEKYENPIPSREFILEHLSKRGAPATREELINELGLTDEADIEALRRRLNAMQRDGQLLLNRRGALALINKLDLKSGRVQGHKDGYGFFIPDDKSGDWLIGQRQMSKVFDGDRVLVRSAGIERGREEALIVEVTHRAHTHIVGRYYEENGVGFVTPDNVRIAQDILVKDTGGFSVTPGEVVSVEILVYPSGRSHPVGRVVEKLGQHMAPGMEIDIALRSYDLPFQWSDELKASLTEIPRNITEAEIEKRVDLRKLHFVTIDGEDARDFDDAVFCQPKAGGWTLYVAIADVSHYVKLNSLLDREAQERGTSVYFPGQVIPMLPELLSNDLCSLNPEVDRLAMVCEMQISKNGVLKKHRFCEAVIRSHARLTYSKVAQILLGNEAEPGPYQVLRRKYADFIGDLENLYSLYKVLRTQREARGAIDFESTELRIVFGEGRKIDRIVPVERNEAHKLIEECMLCANVAAAHFLESHQLPGLYRVHERPSGEKLAALRQFLGELSLSLSGGDVPEASDYQQVIEQIEGRPDAGMINTVLLRSMKQAVYSPENQGHFGLAYEAYAHFTSPIRRYPDLLVHRAIRSVIRSQRKSDQVLRVDKTRPLAKKDIYPYDMSAMIQLGEQCSQNERRADEAVRDVMNWLKCEYVQDRVGEVFEGIITGVTNFGIFVELQGVYVEGLVHVSALDNDYYQFDAAKHRLIGERTHQVYQLADSLLVKVVRVSLDDRKVELELPPGAGKPRRRMPRPQSQQLKGKRAEVERQGAKRGGQKPKSSTKKSAKTRSAKSGAGKPVQPKAKKGRAKTRTTGKKGSRRR